MLRCDYCMQIGLNSRQWKYIKYSRWEISWRRERMLLLPAKGTWHRMLHIKKGWAPQRTILFLIENHCLFLNDTEVCPVQPLFFLLVFCFRFFLIVRNIISLGHLFFAFPAVEVIPDFRPGFIGKPLFALFVILTSWIFHGRNFNYSTKKLYHYHPVLTGGQGYCICQASTFYICRADASYFLSCFP